MMHFHIKELNIHSGLRKETTVCMTLRQFLKAETKEQKDTKKQCNSVNCELFESLVKEDAY